MKVIKKYMSHSKSENLSTVLAEGELYLSDSLTKEIEYIEDTYEADEVIYVYEVTFKRIKEISIKKQTEVKDIK